MKDKIEIILSFNEIIIGKQIVVLLDHNYENDSTIDNYIDNKCSQITVSYKLSQTICFTKKLESCAHFRRNVFNNLKEFLNKNSRKKRNKSRNEVSDKTEKNSYKSNSMTIRIYTILKSMDPFVIDKLWNKNVLSLVVIRFRIEESLAWLSTLGGAYSSLGEQNVNCAIRAGQISISQLHLASLCGDPNIISRCGIYLVYSLCQQNKKKEAIKLIKRTVYPYISRIVNCDKIVKSMYSAVCYRIRHFDNYNKLTINKS